MDIHYVCTGGCAGVSDHPGTCQAVSCAKFGHDLAPCTCTDNKHTGFVTACVKCGKLCKLKGGCEIEPYKKELKA